MNEWTVGDIAEYLGCSEYLVVMLAYEWYYGTKATTTEGHFNKMDAGYNSYFKGEMEGSGSQPHWVRHFCTTFDPRDWVMQA